MQRYTISRKFTRFTIVGPDRRALLTEACAWLMLSRIMLLFIPFARLAPYLGKVLPVADARLHRAPKSPDQIKTAREIGWAVTRASRHVPFRAVCLPQAMAAKFMLSRRCIGSILHFGAAIENGKDLKAHAWLDCGEIEVTGYPVASQFAELACFL